MSRATRFFVDHPCPSAIPVRLFFTYEERRVSLEEDGTDAAPQPPHYITAT